MFHKAIVHKLSRRFMMGALIASLLFSHLLGVSAQAVSTNVYLPLVSSGNQSSQQTAAIPVTNEATTISAATTSTRTLTVPDRLGIGTDTPRASLHITNEFGPPPSTLPAAQNGLLLGVERWAGYKWIQSYGGGLAINPLAGNVGIGTTTPQARLDVNGSFRVTNGSSGMSLDTNGIVITGSKVGVGTTTPQKSLDVNGDFRVTKGSAIVDVGTGGIIITGGGPSLNVGTSAIIITGGNVGIGTTTPQARLDVNGDLRVTGRLLVNGAAMNVPDYVFESGYPLLSLDELRAYLTTEKHLPNVPSAKTIQQGNLDMSELQLKLLEKVEELTLYTLAQDEQLKTQQAQLDLLKQQTADLETRLVALEQK